MNAQDIAAIKELAIALKNDPASTTLGNAQLHGPNQSGVGYGPLTAPGVRPGMLSAFQRPKSLASALPLIISDVATEKIEIMTGMTEEGGTNATGFCGDPPGPGALKKCQQNYVFGKYYVKDDLRAVAEIGLRKDRADVPRNILNAGPSDLGNRWVPGDTFQLADTMSQLRYAWYQVGVGVERDVCYTTISGDTTKTSANTQHGFIKEYAGLDGQIKTGYSDLDTGLVCPAADSYVFSFNAPVTGTDAATSRNIVQVITDMVKGINLNARATGLVGTTWALVMREDLFHPLVETFSCNYLTARCSITDNAAQRQDAQIVNALRLEMMTGQYLLVDGIRVPIILDECVVRETLGNQYYKSDIYYVPLDWSGMPLTYFQYFNMDNQYSAEFTNFLSGSDTARMNNGLYYVSKRDTGTCIEHHYQMVLRLILEAPFLAGRIDDVWYNFYAPMREAIPGSSLYVDGGASYLP